MKINSKGCLFNMEVSRNSPFQKDRESKSLTYSLGHEERSRRGGKSILKGRKYLLFH